VQPEAGQVEDAMDQGVVAIGDEVDAIERARDGARQYVGAQTTISAKNQITLPARIARFLGLQSGDMLRFSWISVRRGRRKIIVEVIREGKRELSLHIIRGMRTGVLRARR